MLEYPVKLTPDEDGGYVVEFPDLGGFSQGDDEEEALHNAVDLLETIVAFRIKDNEPVPKPGKHKNLPKIAVPPVTAAKLALYWEMQKKGMRKAGLARRLHLHGPQVDRLLDVHHESKMSQLETALAAMGVKLVTEIRPL